MDKQIVIADIASEVGAKVAASLAAKGWMVTGISAGKAEADYCCNLLDRAEVIETVDRIEAERGPIYGLFTATAFELPGIPFLSATPDKWQARLDAWLALATNLSFACGRQMARRKEGRIMVLAPDFSRVKGDCVVEATAAGALHGFLKSFGAEVAGEYVCVNGIYAGLPFDFEAINSTCDYLLDDGAYVSAQLISLAENA